MRIICDVCESAQAVLFCAADEAALCRPCDDKVHMCNKLANRHVRVGLADPSEVPRCDICENAPGKRTHGRYLLLRQRVEFPGDKSGHMEDLSMQPKDHMENTGDHIQVPKLTMREKLQNHIASTARHLDANGDDHGKIDSKMIDLNARPHRTHELASNTQTQETDPLSGSYHECAGVVPSGHFRSDMQK